MIATIEVYAPSTLQSVFRLTISRVTTMKRLLDDLSRHAARRIAVWLICCLFSAEGLCARADEQRPVSAGILDPLPYGQAPVDYYSPQADNAVERLNRRLDSGETTLTRDGQFGYLNSLLDEFGVPACSQLFVFSKTAVNQQFVSPQTPRAVYFNDEVYVAWVPGAPAVEVAAVDRNKGALFYQLPQDSGQPPRLVRESRCLGCHVGDATLQVPGFVSRSILTDAHGKPLSDQLTAVSPLAGRPSTFSSDVVSATGSRGNNFTPLILSNVTHETPLGLRWAGWYVTGLASPSGHSGNTFLATDQATPERDRPFRKRALDPRATVDLSRYPANGSDAVAHLVFSHQVHGQNLMARVLYEARFNRQSDAEERLVRYLLLADEAPLGGLDAGRSRYSRWFEGRYPADSPGGRLRQFDLKSRVFKRRLSYLVDTPAFDSLPGTVKRRLRGRIEDILTDVGVSQYLAGVSRAERLQLLESLRSVTGEADGPPGGSGTGNNREKTRPAVSSP